MRNLVAEGCLSAEGARVVAHAEYFAAFRGGVALPARIQKFMVTHALDTLKLESVEEVENMSLGAFVASVKK